MYYFTICAIVKDESNDIEEWIAYHRAIGVEHFYIYDNGSHIPLKFQLKSYIDNGIVTVIDFPVIKSQQLSAYMSALQKWGNCTEWMGFIDIDEFIVPIVSDDMVNILMQYPDIGGIGINWNIFSSCGYISRPSGGILKNYTQSLGLDPHIKSIIRPQAVAKPLSPHHFQFIDKFYCVNEDGIPINSYHSYPIGDKIKINHYYYKSQQDYEAKIERGFATQMRSIDRRSMEPFFLQLDQKTVTDEHILRFVPKLENFKKENLRKTGHKNPVFLPPLATERMKPANIPISFEKGIAEANMCLLNNCPGKAFEILQNIMASQNLCVNELRECYVLLRRYYWRIGKRTKAAAIKDYLL